MQLRTKVGQLEFTKKAFRAWSTYETLKFLKPQTLQSLMTGVLKTLHSNCMLEDTWLCLKTLDYAWWHLMPLEYAWWHLIKCLMTLTSSYFLICNHERI